MVYAGHVIFKVEAMSEAEGVKKIEEAVQDIPSEIVYTLLTDEPYILRVEKGS
jgi:hypothetical protein